MSRLAAAGLAFAAILGTTGPAYASNVPGAYSHYLAAPALHCSSSIGAATMEPSPANVVLGPVTFLGLNDLKPNERSIAQTGVTKSMLVLTGQKPATVRIEPGTSNIGSLLYRPSLLLKRRKFFRPADGDKSLLVYPCSGLADTGYVGGIIARPGSCLTIVVSSQGIPEPRDWTLRTSSKPCSA